MKRLAWSIAMMAAALTLVGARAACAADVPAAKIVTATMEAPATAWSEFGTATIHTTGAAAWSANPPEIKALARSLGAGRIGAGTGQISQDEYAQRVFDYVRNNIATEFRFGLGKGARGALIDQSGTPFDQAELMVRLLREGGVTASFKVGTISISAADFGRWSGFTKNLTQATQTFDVDAKAACQYLADGGFPAVVNGSSDCSTLSGNLPTTGTPITMGHIWVAAGGKLYDPAFKRNTLKKGIDLPAAMGCGTASSPTCGSTATTQALSGASTSTVGGSSAYQNINETAVNSQLATYAQNLETAIKGIDRNAPLEDIVGGVIVDLTYQPTVGTSLPYTSSEQYSWTGDVPDQYRTTFRVQYLGIDQTLYADETAGRRLRLVMTSTWNSSTSQYDYFLNLYADDMQLAQVNCNSCNPLGSSVTLSANHPYRASSGAYADETITLPITGYLPLTLVLSAGDSTVSTQKFASDLSVAHLTAIWAAKPEQPTFAAQLLVQGALANKIVGATTGAPITQHHALGVVSGTVPAGTFQQTFVSAETMISANAADSSRTSARNAAFETSSSMWSILEGSISQQSADTWDAFSAAPELVVANRKGTKLVNVASANMSTLISSGALTNYTSARQTRLQDIATQGYDMILPQSGTGVCDAYPYTNHCPGGSGTLAYKSGALAYLYNETMKGGAAPPSRDPALDTMNSVKQVDYSIRRKSYASVDPASGALRMSPPPDIVTGAGEFPYSLPFQRTYDSGAGAAEDAYGPQYFDIFSPDKYHHFYSGADADSMSRLGGSWTHNYQITARLGANPLKALGQDTALDASAMIAGVYTLQDTAGSPSFSQRLTGIFASAWLGQQLVNNSATLTFAGRSIVFQKLPSGVFNPPVGEYGRLTQSGSRVAVNPNGGPVYNYNYAGITLTYTGKDGSVISFDTSDYSAVVYKQPLFKATAWTFPSGVKITFNYVSSNATYNYPYVLSSVSNNLGRSLTFTTQMGQADDYSARITSVTDENGRQVSYGLTGCAVVFGDPGGGALTKSFDCDTLTVTRPDSSVLKYSYVAGTDSPDPATPIASTYRLRRWYTPSNLTNAYQVVAYDDLYRAKTLTDILGHQSQYFAGGVAGSEPWKRAESLDPLGNSTINIFDRYSSVTKATNPLGNSTTYTYDSARRRLKTTNPEGDSVENTYDVRGNTLAVTQHAKPGSGLTDIVTSTTYGEGATVVGCTNQVTCNLPVTMTNPHASSVTDTSTITTNISWNSTTGMPTQVLSPVDAAGVRPQTDYAYTLYGPGGSQFSLLTSRTDKISTTQSVVTSYAYNASNKYVLSSASVDPSGLNLTTGFTFDAVGNVSAVDGPRSDVTDVTNYVWTSLGQLQFVIQPDPDGAGSLLRPAVRFTYDSDGQLTQADKGTTTTATGSDFSSLEAVTYAYDTVGNKIKETTNAGVTQFSYDADDRPECTAIRMNPAVYASLPASACTQSTLNTDRITRTVYDAGGQVTKTQRAYGTARQQDYVTLTYSANGKTLTQTDALSNTSTLEYDGFDRQVKLRFPGVTAGSGTSSTTDYEQYGYDAAGNRTSFRKRDGSTITYNYDALNRPVLKDIPSSTTADVYTAYDLKGRPLYAHFGSAGGSGVDYAYDVAGRLTSEAAGGRTLTYLYDAAGNRTRVTWPDSFYAGYSYDALNRLISVTENGATSGVGVLDTFAYDNLGRRTGITRGNGTTTSYGYDSADRLSSLAQTLGGSGNNVTWTFSYNPASQLVTKTDSNSAYAWLNHPNGTVNKTYDGLNRDGTIVAISGYDLNQNLTNDGSRTFTYDVENRLTAVGGLASMTLSYDPLGRLQQTVAGSTTTQFLYSGDKLVGEYDGSGTLQRRYVHGVGTDEPLVWYQGSGTTDRRWLHADRQGSIVAWSDATGALMQIQAYGPYGEPQAWGGSRFAYTGQIMLPEVKLYHYKARVYDPVIGRFLQTDPVGYRDSYNLYAYVANDPVNVSDPTGLWGVGEPKNDKEWIDRDREEANNHGGLFDPTAYDPASRWTSSSAGDGGQVEPEIEAEPLPEESLSDESRDEPAQRGEEVRGEGEFDETDAAINNAAGGSIRSMPLPAGFILRSPQVQATIRLIDAGGPYPYRQDGTPFQNREGRLPITGSYVEFTVETPGISNRGAQRIVEDVISGRLYYTDDHYETFTRIR